MNKTGAKSDGTTVSQAFSFPASKTMQLVTLKWTGVTQVKITNSGVYDALDNFVLN